MNKYLIIVISGLILLSISNIISYNKGIIVGTNEQITIQSDIITKFHNENNQTLDSFNKSMNEQESKIVYKFKDRVIIKEITRIQRESCVTGSDITNVLNEGLK